VVDWLFVSPVAGTTMDFDRTSFGLGFAMLCCMYDAPCRAGKLVAKRIRESMRLTNLQNK